MYVYFNLSLSSSSSSLSLSLSLSLSPSLTHTLIFTLDTLRGLTELFSPGSSFGMRPCLTPLSSIIISTYPLLIASRNTQCKRNRQGIQNSTRLRKQLGRNKQRCRTLELLQLKRFALRLLVLCVCVCTDCSEIDSWCNAYM